MAARATVRAWQVEEGWGVLDCAETPGGCWASFADVAVATDHALSAGTDCWLEWEAGSQDGYGFRAVRVWPVGADPVERPPQRHSTAYRSELRMTYGD